MFADERCQYLSKNKVKISIDEFYSKQILSEMITMLITPGLSICFI